MDDKERKKHDKQMRRQYRNIIKDAFLKNKQVKKLSPETIEYITKALERGCNNKAIRKSHNDKVTPIWWSNPQFCAIYSSIVYKLSLNLNPKSEVHSEFLINLILKCHEKQERIKLSQIPDMHSNDMCPEKSQPIIQEHQKRLHKKVKLKTTNRYPCPKCKGREATRQEKQLCSFDEGTNISLTCTYCNFHWIL